MYWLKVREIHISIGLTSSQGIGFNPTAEQGPGWLEVYMSRWGWAGASQHKPYIQLPVTNTMYISPSLPYAICTFDATIPHTKYFMYSRTHVPFTTSTHACVHSTLRNSTDRVNGLYKIIRVCMVHGFKSRGCQECGGTSISLSLSFVFFSTDTCV